MTLVDELDSPASSASYANAGMLTPSMPEPWNGPGVYKNLIKSLFNADASMRLRWHAIPGLMDWGIKFLKYSSKFEYQYLIIIVYGFKVKIDKNDVNLKFEWDESDHIIEDNDGGYEGAIVFHLKSQLVVIQSIYFSVVLSIYNVIKPFCNGNCLFSRL